MSEFGLKDVKKLVNIDVIPKILEFEDYEEVYEYAKNESGENARTDKIVGYKYSFFVGEGVFRKKTIKVRIDGALRCANLIEKTKRNEDDILFFEIKGLDLDFYQNFNNSYAGGMKLTADDIVPIESKKGKN
jgi:hypothetical protein